MCFHVVLCSPFSTRMVLGGLPGVARDQDQLLHGSTEIPSIMGSLSPLCGKRGKKGKGGRIIWYGSYNAHGGDGQTGL